MPHLLLVRHGRTRWNLEQRGQGRADIPLDDIGRAQAAAAGAAIAALRPAAILSSTSSRAYDTALAIGLPVRTDPRLQEIDLGTYEGKLLSDWQADAPDEFARSQAGHDVRRGGGELNTEVGERALPAVREGLAALADPDDLLVVVSHGGTIRALLRILLDLPPAPWCHLGVLGNTCCAVLDRDEHRGWRLQAYGLPAADLRPRD